MIAVEKVTRQWTDDYFPAARVVTETPADFDVMGNLPLIKVWRVGGGNRLILDQVRMSVDTFQLSRDDSRILAEQVRDAWLYKLSGSKTGGLYVTRVECTTGPIWVPYDNPNVRRFNASYTLHVKPL